MYSWLHRHLLSIALWLLVIAIGVAIYAYHINAPWIYLLLVGAFLSLLLVTRVLLVVNRSG
jgi:hypothetical protein